jgi:hypothetical protein
VFVRERILNRSPDERTIVLARSCFPSLFLLTIPGRDSQSPISRLLLFPLKAIRVSRHLSLVALEILGYRDPAFSLASKESLDEFNRHLS